MLFKPVMARVGIKRDKDGVYDDKNCISKVKGPDYQPKGDVPVPGLAGPAQRAGSHRRHRRGRRERPAAAHRGARHVSRWSSNCGRRPSPLQGFPVMQLRPYQIEALQKLFAYWRAGGGNPLVAKATGTGKSVVIASLSSSYCWTIPKLRVLLPRQTKNSSTRT